MTMSLPPVGLDRPVEPPAPSQVAAPRAAAVSEPAPQAEHEARASAVDQVKAMRKQIEEALAELNQQMKVNGRNLAFSVDDKANRMVIRVTDSVTGEVVRQIPDETVLRIAHSIEDFKGVMLDQST